MSRYTINHFLLVLSIIYPVKKEINKPGIVADAIILPKANSDPVWLRTSQLTAIKLKPNPIRDVMLPKKKRRKVGFFNIFIILL